MPDLPIACTLSHDAPDARRKCRLAELLRQSTGQETLPEGIRLRFAPAGEMLSTLAAAVEAERHCCRFLRFTLIVEPDEGPFVLDLTGPRGTHELLAAMLESS